MTDPLADVIERAGRDWYEPNADPGSKSEHQAKAVKAHIAAVLDAEETRWEPTFSDPVGTYEKTLMQGVSTVLADLRVSLLGKEQP